MLDLSIVIVNYNVREFLTQCLDSIYKSQTHYSFEVIVVDNASKEPAREAILDKFPKVRWVQNTENVGFGKANNQGFDLALGTFTLILNPDTVLQEDTLEVALTYMHEHPEVGGLGIKGIDGSGQFLPESKRGLPTPLTALFKISGLSKLFPRSPLFARYHLGHLSPDLNHEVDILVGCFMMVPSNLLREVGGFDPRYFMYGEDIDLSYELLKTGRKNHYLAESQIIHYKGESTKRGSLNYVRMFYQAMVIFARKQFSGSSALAYTLLIYFGIYLRATLAVVARLGRSAFAPLLDAAILFYTLDTLKQYWESNHRFINGGSYPDTYTYFVQGSYVLVWILALWISGTYDKNARPKQMITSFAWATLFLGFAYGLLPEAWRFSRALLVLGTMGGAMAVLAWRYLLEITTRKELFSRPVQRPRVVFVGSNEQKEELVNLFKNNGIQPAYFEHFNLDPVSNFDHLSALLEWHRINELILDTTSLSYTHIMELFQSVSKEVRIKTLGSDQSFLVGSESSFTQGSSLKSANYATSNTVYLRQKRILDQMVALTVVASLPIGIPLSLMTRRYRSWRTLLQKSHLLLIGKHTLVGYSPSLAKELGLPVLPEPIFNICTGIPHLLSQQQTCYALVKNYAKEADIQGDLTQLWRLSK